MPIDTLKHAIHIRRKKNKRVFDNIDRLWRIARHADSAEQILDQLHPWNAPITLKFENILPILLAILGIFFMVLVYFGETALWKGSTVLLGLGSLLWAYLSYEPSQALDEVIEYLEKQIINKKYQLHAFTSPQSMHVATHSTSLIFHLKQLFPLFNQGSLRNELSYYASTHWQDEEKHMHPVLLFQYHFVDEIRVRNKDGNEVTIKERHQDLWGCFIFDVRIQGIAIRTSSQKVLSPYAVPWQSSDIQINQKLRFLGTDPMQMAKVLSPAFVLRAADFFKTREGDILFHPEKNVLCYLGTENLFEISSKTKKIKDISALRGHLRTFTLPYLERFKADIIQFLK